jgi:hypothetical protein
MTKDNPKRDGGSVFWTCDGLPAWAVALRQYLNRGHTKNVILAALVTVVMVMTVSLGGALPLGGAWSGTMMVRNGPDTPVSPNVKKFLSNLPRYSLDMAQSGLVTPQSQAMEWMRIDPLYNDYELHRLNQRYALAVLYFSAPGAWLSTSSECTWYRSSTAEVCDESFRLTSLNLWDSGTPVEGYLPSELELLTDLKTLKSFGQPALLDGIYSSV